MSGSLRQDLAHALRGLRRAPGFASVAILSLAIGIGVNTAAFSFIDALLLRPLPFPHADELIDVFETHPTEVCAGCGVGTSRAVHRDLDGARTLAGVAAWRTEEVIVRMRSGAERFRAAHVSAALFPLLGIVPLRGRVFEAEDERASAGSVVLLSEPLWRDRFGASPDAVGQSLRVNGRERVVVGVLPAATTFPPFADLWLPLDAAGGAEARDERTVGVIARLAPGRSLAEARAELDAIGRRNEADDPATSAGWSLRAVPLRTDMAGDYTPTAFAMFTIVGLVLLAACANVGGLVLARTAVRRHEFATRATLGASRTTLIRQLLTESTVVCAIGGGAGVLVAVWLVDAFVAVAGFALPAWVELHVDGRALLFTAAVALIAGPLTGLAPALRTIRGLGMTRLVPSRRTDPGAVRAGFGSALVVVQIAAATSLFAGALILTNEFVRISRFEPGHDTNRLFSASLLMPAESGRNPIEIAEQSIRIEARLRAELPVEHAAVSSFHVPNWPGTPRHEIRLDDGTVVVPGVVHRVINVTPGYFATMRTPVVAGRAFTAADARTAGRVGIVGEALAARLWPGTTGIGRRVHLGGPGDEWITIVGMVPSARTSAFARDVAQLLYVPMAQHVTAQPTPDRVGLHLRARGDAPNLGRDLRAALSRIDPDIVIEDLRSAHDAMRLAAAPVRTTALAATALGTFAMLLAAMGVFGLIAFSVAQRIPEFGVRIALGATPAGIGRLVLRQAAGICVPGLVLGLLGAAAVAAILRTQMVGLRLPGWALALVVPLVIALLGLVAAWLPARRAVRMEPLAALRADG